MAGIYSSCADALQALAHGPGEFTCHDFDTVREVVMCDAWHRMETPEGSTPINFSEAVKASWAQVRQACAPVGGIEHEINTPVDHAEKRDWPVPPTVSRDYKIVDVQGRTVGRVAAASDGAVTFCVHGDCHTDFRTSPGRDQETILAAVKDIYPTVGYHLVPTDEGGG